MSCRFDELRQKEVISICDGSCLGYISDLEVDVSCGKICALYTGCRPFFGRGRGGRWGETCVPWDKIVRIGRDTILVEVKGEDCSKKDKSKT